MGADLHSHYSILAKIGGGGMGVVYLARDLRLNRHVAIKRLNAVANGDAALRRRFLNEAHAVAALGNIYIVHIYALGEDAEGPYIVMEYVGGPDAAPGGGGIQRDAPNPPLSLETQVAQNGQYTLDEALELVMKISKAVAYAHACGVIHRDLKPSNILIDSAGEPKIIDFGLARVAGGGESALTGPGEKLLSLGYGAPEQETDSSNIDERADVYGLGGILYFAITGQNPRYFREQDIPALVVEPLVKALATDREQRWPSAKAFHDALSAVHSRTRVEQPPAKTTWRCKWCDTVNPVTIRFCSECGWDGVVSCPECGSENIVGMQFCAKCGANVRVYEAMQALAVRIRRALDDGEVEKAVSLAGQSHGFEPAGPSGRALLQDIRELGEKARGKISRREQLKELIPMELKAENFERARDFILEYRALCANDGFYGAELAAIPGNIAQRDYRRADRACRNGDFAHALGICNEVLGGVAPQHQGCLGLRRKILRRRMARRIVRPLLAFAAMAVLYAAALPAVVAAFGTAAPGRVLSAFFAPARRLFLAGDAFRLRSMSAYSGLFGVDAAALASFVARDAEPDAAIEDPPPPAPPAELVALMADYDAKRARIEDEYARKISEWPALYLDDLEKLLKASRNQGDYFNVADATKEIERFSSTREWVPYEGPSEALSALQLRHLETTRGYGAKRADDLKKLADATEAEMGNLMKRFVQQDDMASARAVLVRLNALKGQTE